MAVTLTNSFEGVTPSGTTLTAGSGGNTGGTSGSYFDNVTIGTGATAASDSTHAAHGSLSCKLATGGTAAQAFVFWSTQLTGSSVATAWVRIYLYLTAYPASGAWRLCQWNAGGTLAAALQVNSTGTVRSINTSSATILTSALTLPLNQWNRIEAFCTGSASAGQVEFRLYTTSPDEALGSYDEIQTSSTTQNTAGAITQVRFGQAAGALASYGPLWMDDVGASDTAYLGPSVPAAGVGMNVGAFVTASPNGWSWQANTAAAVTAWVSDSGRPLTTQRYYTGQGNMPTTVPADVSAALTAGRRVLFSYKPLYVIGSNTLPPLASGGQTQGQLDTSVTTLLSALVTAGATAKNLVIDLWQEPYTVNGFNKAGHNTFADFVTMFQHYYTLIHSNSPFLVAWCTSAGNGVAQNGEDASYPGDAFTDIVATDFYTGAYQQGCRLSGYDPFGGGKGNTSQYNAFYRGDNATPPKPCSIYETGGTLRLSNGISVTTFVSYLKGMFINRTSQGLPNNDLAWFCSGNDANNSPIAVPDGTAETIGGAGVNLDYGQTEIRNGLFAQLYDALTAPAAGPPAPLYPLISPVAAQLRRNSPGGPASAYRLPLAVRPAVGPVFRQAVRPARAARQLPPKGRDPSITASCAAPG